MLKTDGLAGVLRPAFETPDVNVAFVFGSVARGDTDASSDIDLMIIGSLGLRRVATLLSGKSDRLGREINPHVMTGGIRRTKKETRPLCNVGARLTEALRQGE